KEGLWQDLASKDAALGHKTMRALVSAPDLAVALFKDKLKAAPPVPEKQVEQWVSDLASNKFAVRDKARKELERLGPDAEPLLRKALKGQLDVEAQRRVETLLQSIQVEPVATDDLRVLRAVEVLEILGTGDAHALLTTLAAGRQADPLTREAR